MSRIETIVEPLVFSSGTARAKASCAAWSFQGLLYRDELALLLHRRRAFRVHRRNVNSQKWVEAYLGAIYIKTVAAIS